jgi:ABC-type Fe2+-enterobactin transport system substrate-binding protein
MGDSLPRLLINFHNRIWIQILVGIGYIAGREEDRQRSTRHIQTEQMVVIPIVQIAQGKGDGFHNRAIVLRQGDGV